MQSVVVNIRNEFLTDNERIKKIPVYQRNYSWTSEECLLLFNDILKIYDEKINEHFIGSIVYKIENSRKNSDLIIIDGQQRLTTLYLLCKAMYDLCDEGKLKYKLEEILKNDRGENTFVLIKSDNEVYKKLLENKHEDLIDKGYRIYENYLLFKNQIINNNIDIEKLYKSIYFLQLVSISLEHSENPQIIFESINSTGLSLTNSDLIRNFLLMNEGYDDQERLFENYWYRFEELLGVDNLTNFFEHYVTIKFLKSTVSRKNMYSRFKEIYSSSNLSVEEFLKEIEEYVEAYSYLVNGSRKLDLKDSILTEKLKRSINNINRLDTKVTYMFLMDIIKDYKNNKIDNTTIVEIFRTVETYILRRLVCNYGSNSLQKIFRYLYSQMRNSKDKLTYLDSFYYNLIITKEDTNGKFPTDEEFKTDLLVANIYKNRKICNVLLYGLENYNSKSKIEFDTLTIEHVMPQTLTPSWRNMLGENYKDIHSKYINRIGNLTHTSSNSELSNKDFSEKLVLLNEESHLKLNQYFTNKEIWNEEEIIKRSEFLTQNAVCIWNTPSFNKDDITKVFEKQKVRYELYELSDTNHFGKLYAFVVNDEIIECNSFKDGYNKVVRYIYELDKAKFFELLVDNENHKIKTKGKELYLYSNNIEHPYGSHKIDGTNIYVFNYYSKNAVISRMEVLAEELKIDIDIMFG